MFPYIMEKRRNRRVGRELRAAVDSGDRRTAAHNADFRTICLCSYRIRGHEEVAVESLIVSNCLVRKKPLLRIPFDWETGVVLQTLGRQADGLSPHADRFNYRRRQESERDHMAYVAITQTFSVRDLFG